MQQSREYRKIRRSKIEALILLVLVLFLGVGIYVSNQTAVLEDVFDDPQTNVIYGQPLEGRYALMPAYHLSISPDSERVSPHLQLPQTTADLGELTDMNQVEETFMVHNTGQGVLRIERIYTTCTCLIAHLTASMIPSGQMALLRVRFDPAHVVATRDGAVGVRYGVFLDSNDPHWPQASVWVEATLSARD